MQGAGMMDGAGTSETHRGPNGGLAEVGALLRDRRVELGHDIQAVADQTHIKIGYLRAIEEGRRRDLPGAAYTIGFVRTYADFLGFDGNRLVNDFHAQLAGARSRPAAQAAAEPPRLTVSPVVVAGAVLALALIGFFAWGYFSDTGNRDAASVEEAEDVPAEEVPAEGEEAPAATAEAPATPAPVGDAAAGDTQTSGAPQTAAQAQPTTQPQTQPQTQGAEAVAGAPAEDQVPPESDTADATAAEGEPVQQAAAPASEPAGKVVLRAKLESWVQITNEKGESVFSRVLRAGETYTVPSEPGLMLTTGNAGGVEVMLDGKKLKSLGSVGLVRRDFPLDAKKLKDGSAFKPASSGATTP